MLINSLLLSVVFESNVFSVTFINHLYSNVNTQGRVYLISPQTSAIKAVVTDVVIGNYSFQSEIYLQ